MDEITNEEYDKMSPRQQGYVTYMQGQWNSNVPNANIYALDTDEGKEFQEGERAGVLEAQDNP